MSDVITALPMLSQEYFCFNRNWADMLEEMDSAEVPVSKPTTTPTPPPPTSNVASTTSDVELPTKKSLNPTSKEYLIIEEYSNNITSRIEKLKIDNENASEMTFLLLVFRMIVTVTNDIWNTELKAAIKSKDLSLEFLLTLKWVSSTILLGEYAKRIWNLDPTFSMNKWACDNKYQTYATDVIGTKSGNRKLRGYGEDMWRANQRAIERLTELAKLIPVGDNTGISKEEFNSLINFRESIIKSLNENIARRKVVKMFFTTTQSFDYCAKQLSGKSSPNTKNNNKKSNF